jgi:hypothetical protein
MLIPRSSGLRREASGGEHRRRRRDTRHSLYQRDASAAVVQGVLVHGDGTGGESDQRCETGRGGVVARTGQSGRCGPGLRRSPRRPAGSRRQPRAAAQRPRRPPLLPRDAACPGGVSGNSPWIRPSAALASSLLVRSDSAAPTACRAHPRAAAACLRWRKAAGLRRVTLSVSARARIA